MSAASRIVWGGVVGISPDGQYEFPQDPGVYVFAQVDADNVHVRYVGMAANLDERISAHLGGTNENDCLQKVLRDTSTVKIRASVQHNKALRINLEHTCYRHYSEQGHQLCNAYKPKGAFVEGAALPF